MSVVEHKAEAPASIGCMIITVSDTRSEETDKSGQLIKQYLQEAGHQTVLYWIVKDERAQIVEAINTGAASEQVDVILLNGGTGIAARDVTYEAVRELLEKELPGFGELFRYLSYAEEIGPAAMLSRAVAGTYRGKAVFSLPGSSGAVRLAMSRLILPELGHVVRELRK